MRYTKEAKQRSLNCRWHRDGEITHKKRGVEGGRGGFSFKRFLSPLSVTAAVWCVPFSVPLVRLILNKLQSQTSKE